MTPPLAAARPALDRARALLDPARARGANAAAHGYVDVLGPEAHQARRPAQRLMQTWALPHVYERLWRPAFGRLAKGALRGGMSEEQRMARLLLELRPAAAVLDVACGTGAFARDFAAAVGPHGLVVGLDGAPAMLARAVADTPQDNVAFVRGDAERLPFASGAFDAVCCFAALHMFADPWAAMDEMARVLASGGRVAILASRRTGLAPLRPLEAGLRAGLGVHTFGGGELTDALAERGFEDLTACGQGLVQYVGGRRA